MTVLDELKQKNMPANVLSIYNKKLTTADEAVRRIMASKNV